MLARVSEPLRLMIYDATCTSDLPWPRPERPRLQRAHDRLHASVPMPGLTHFWKIGGALYGALARLDRRQGFRDWGSALDWLASVEPQRKIAEIQFWGHGKWGAAKIDREALTIDSLAPGHPHRAALEAIRERLEPSVRPLWWFRTCETFGARPGHEFAQAWTEFFGCRAAGHTYIIGPWQSGLHTLDPGETPRWSIDEGLLEGTPDEPRKALWSRRSEPNTITCLHGTIPAGF